MVNRHHQMRILAVPAVLAAWVATTSCAAVDLFKGDSSNPKLNIGADGVVIPPDPNDATTDQVVDYTEYRVLTGGGADDVTDITSSYPKQTGDLINNPGASTKRRAAAFLFAKANTAQDLPVLSGGPGTAHKKIVFTHGDVSGHPSPLTLAALASNKAWAGLAAELHAADEHLDDFSDAVNAFRLVTVALIWWPSDVSPIDGDELTAAEAMHSLLGKAVKEVEPLYNNDDQKLIRRVDFDVATLAGEKPSYL